MLKFVMYAAIVTASVTATARDYLPSISESLEPYYQRGEQVFHTTGKFERAFDVECKINDSDELDTFKLRVEGLQDKGDKVMYFGRALTIKDGLVINNYHPHRLDLQKAPFVFWEAPDKGKAINVIGDLWVVAVDLLTQNGGISLIHNRHAEYLGPTMLFSECKKGIAKEVPLYKLSPTKQK